MLKIKKIVSWAIMASVTIIILLLTTHVIEHRRSYIEQWMRFTLRNEQIVIALSTTPYRIKNIKHTLELLHLQNVPIQAIYVSIPYVFKRDNIAYEIPAWLNEDKRITILRTEDYGPATKLLGALKNAPINANTIIITVDDDIDYPSNLVLHLAYRAKYNPNSAIGLSGVNIDYDATGVIAADSKDGLININNSDVSVAALQGVAGVAYRSYFFDDTVYNILTAPRECINSDDLYISFYLATKNIERRTFKSRYIKVKDISVEELGTQADALHNQFPAETDRHRSCLDFLQQKHHGVRL